MTEKRKPHYVLEELKKLVRSDATRILTRPTIKSGHALGFSETEIVEVILSLNNAVFFKSMTCEFNNKLWQDVYKPSAKRVSLYVKIQKDLGGVCVVISFKKNTGGL